MSDYTTMGELLVMEEGVSVRGVSNKQCLQWSTSSPKGGVYWDSPSSFTMFTLEQRRLF